MPDEQTLREMYGPSYVMSFSPDPSIDDPKEPEKVLAWLAKSGKGTFIDYGCGKGELLNAAADLGWNVLGVEFDDEVALKLKQQTGLEVLTTRQALASEAIADVLHLGDVVEHMTKINEQMPEVLKLIKPGGYLIAQGPLEGNLNVFTLGIRLSRSLRSANIEMAPFHVMLATKKGQEECFRRFNLTQQEFSVTEVDWPAPSHLSSSDLLSPRLVGLFTLRRLSRLVSLVRPGWCNRYFYIGRQDG
jgi:SAM-dependent methyltransferase